MFLRNKMDDLLNGVDTMENGDIEYEDWHPPTEAELKVIEAKRERQDKISKLMGEYLLKGYKMLGSTCPLCLTILLRTKQGVDYCVACSELDSDSTKDDPGPCNHNCALVTNVKFIVTPQKRKATTTLFQDRSAKVPNADHVALSDIAAQRQAQESYLKQVTVTAAGDTCAEDRRTDASGGISTSSATVSSIGHDRTTACASENGGVEKQASSITQKPVKQLFGPLQRLEDRLDDATVAVAEKLEWATGLLRETQDLDTSVRLCNLIKCCAETISSLRSVDRCDT